MNHTKMIVAADHGAKLCLLPPLHCARATDGYYEPSPLRFSAAYQRDEWDVLTARWSQAAASDSAADWLAVAGLVTAMTARAVTLIHLDALFSVWLVAIAHADESAGWHEAANP